MELKLLTFNLRGWPVNHKRILNSLDGLAGLVNSLGNDPDIICIQELPYGKDGFYVHRIEGLLPNYTLEMPMFFDPDSYKSACSAVLVNNNSNLSVLALRMEGAQDSERTDFSYLYNEMMLAKDGESFFLTNVHIPQISMNSGKPVEYQLGRIAKNNHMWNCLLKDVLKKDRTKQLIVGDFNCDNKNSCFQTLTEMVPDSFDDEGSAWKNTYVDPHGKSHRYDYVLSNFGGRSKIINEPYVLQYSDHCAVYYEVS